MNIVTMVRGDESVLVDTDHSSSFEILTAEGWRVAAKVETPAEDADPIPAEDAEPVRPVKKAPASR